MKHVLTTLLMTFLCLHLQAQELSSTAADKTALLMVHYGTAYDETRAKTIDAVNLKARQTFPQLEVREAYLSPVVIRRLKGRGISKETPYEAMLRLRDDGYTRLMVQPTCLLDGEEMDVLRRDVARVDSLFESVSIGRPLFYSIANCLRVVDVMTKRHPADSLQREHVVFVGHGSSTPATALYAQLDYMLRATGHPCHHVTTIEGYPTFDTCLAQLRSAAVRRVKLVPLLFVAGNHAMKAIGGSWRQRLKQEGFSVEVVLEGLGEVSEIQEMYIQSARMLEKTEENLVF